eukprot:gene10051-20940_t
MPIFPPYNNNFICNTGVRQSSLVSMALGKNHSTLVMIVNVDMTHIKSRSLQYITIFCSYFSSFSVVLLVPLDIALTMTYRNPSDPYYHSSEFKSIQQLLVQFFYAFFWPTFFLGSFGLVFEEYYNVNGHFTVASKLISSLLNFSIAYIAMFIGGAIFFGVLIGQKYVSSSASALTLVAVVLSNTFGLIALMVLLGYGLIEFPRHFWSDSDLEGHLVRTQQRAASQYRNLQETSLNISLLVSDAMKTNQE